MSCGGILTAVPNFRLNSTIEFRKGSPTPRNFLRLWPPLMDFLISSFFPYIVPSSVYIRDKEPVQFGAGGNFAQFSAHIFPLGEEKKMKSRAIVIALPTSVPPFATRNTL